MKMLTRVGRTAVSMAMLAAVLGCEGVRPTEFVPERLRGTPVAEEHPFADARRFEREAVAADHPEASAAGAEILELGGNAVDAAVATSFALSVVRPESCGIGGGGFMVIHLAAGPRRGNAPDAGPQPPLNIVIDYRERAPASASPDMFAGLPAEASQWSGKSVAIPGTVAGLLHALERYGTLDRATVLAPAIRLARNGYAFDAQSRRAAKSLGAFLDSHTERPRREAAAMRGRFILPEPPEPRGESLDKPDKVVISRNANPQQASLLRSIARYGVNGYYRGPVAQAIVGAVQRHAGALTLEDLRGVRVREAAPLTAAWRGKTVLTMPLPSSGGITLVQTLELMERTRPMWEQANAGGAARLAALLDEATRLQTEKGRLVEAGVDKNDALAKLLPVFAPTYIHALAESFKHAFADRAQYLGDPAFMPANPTARLLDPARLEAKAKLIDAGRTLDDDAYAESGKLADLLSVSAAPPDDHGTSHFSVVDRWGNAVACTETINLSFGSRIFVTEYGFCLNNQMDDFQTRRGEPNAFALVQSDRNLPQPGKCPLSSMTPTIVLDAEGRVETVVGASGGPRIITGTVQSLLMAQEPGFSAAAVGLPRIHHQWKPAALLVEPGAVPARLHLLGSGFGDSTDPLDELMNQEAELLEEDPFWGAGLEELTRRGHAVKPMLEGAAVQMIQRDPNGKGWQAASDPRKGGAPAGR